ncbi:MAG: hypothetical protein M1282_14465 [Chloroflexi bacterium]|nr:hypothetical protein [Chloroflexota bacterium]
MKKIFYTLALLMILLAPVSSAYAQTNGHLDGRVVIGQDFTLKSGETLEGDLVVIGGQAVIQDGATVNGNVVIIGGSLNLEGQATGDAVVIGGLASLGTHASLSGNMVTLGGSLQRADGAFIGGNVVTNMPAPSIQIPVSPSSPQTPPTPRYDWFFNPVWTVANIFFQAIALAALAMLLTVFLHPQLDRVAQAIIRQPFIAGSLGLLTAFLTPITLVILVITLILIPVALAAVILLVLAWLFGVIALGMEVGDRFTQAIHQTWAPVLSAGFGTFLLMIVVGALNQVPCIGWMAGVLVGLVGVGAVVMTLFGTRPVLHPAMAVIAPPSDSSQNIPPAS